MERETLHANILSTFCMPLLANDCTVLCYNLPSHDSRDDYSRVAPKRVERMTIAAPAIGAMANGAGVS